MTNRRGVRIHWWSCSSASSTDGWLCIHLGFGSQPRRRALWQRRCRSAPKVGRLSVEVRSTSWHSKDPTGNRCSNSNSKIWSLHPCCKLSMYIRCLVNTSSLLITVRLRQWDWLLLFDDYSYLPDRRQLCVTQLALPGSAAKFVEIGVVVDSGSLVYRIWVNNWITRPPIDQPIDRFAINEQRERCTLCPKGVIMQLSCTSRFFHRKLFLIIRNKLVKPQPWMYFFKKSSFEW